jgi:Undecaprenyl-phosphate glucose phosphotransferase
MGNASRLKKERVAQSGALSADQYPPSRARAFVPFHWIEAIAVCSDLVLIPSASLVTGIAYHIAFLGGIGPIPAFLGIGVLTAVNFTAILAARAAYRPQNLVNFRKQAQESTTVWLFVFFVLSAVAFSLKISQEYSRGATLSFFAAGWLLILAWRLVIARFVTRALAGAGFAEQKSILIGQKQQLSRTNMVEELTRCGYRPVRTFEFASNSILSPNASTKLGQLIQDVVEVTRQERIGQVFLLAPWDDWHFIERLMELLRIVAVPIYLLPDENVARLLGYRIVNVGTAWTAELKRAPLTALEQICKRAIDLLIASAGLVLLAPLMIVVAALIKMDSRGPILFTQTRDGFNGRPFKIWKFRTMAVLEDGAVIRQATKNDSRVTRFGRLLRRSNLDELPQLLNVIAGHMSLVGPRPHASAHNSEYEKIIASYAYRYHVKPGLTGWAQVNGLRGETRTLDLMAKRVEFDLWYIDNWSLLLDVQILLRTLVLGLQPNAY